MARTTAEKKDDYPFIRAWGMGLGSSPAYIEEQVERARREQAPDDATYRDSDGAWHRYRETTNLVTRTQMDGLLRGRFGIDPPEPDPIAMRDAAIRGVEHAEIVLRAARVNLARREAKVRNSC